jgi:MOSC domain-containing protein YiiM
MDMNTVVTALFAGKVRPMPEDGRPTGIFKLPVSGPVQIGVEGLVTDQQADRRVHGGPEKAVHHFPIENHRRLAARFPEQAPGFVAGGLGENISTEGLTEENICIGDVYQFGSVQLQVSQPRSPCWKIDARHGREGITRYTAEVGISGWYYRVLHTGQAQAGDSLNLIERVADPVTLREIWTVAHTLRPGLPRLQRIIDTPGLNPSLRQRLLERAQWLRQQASS